MLKTAALAQIDENSPLVICPSLRTNGPNRGVRERVGTEGFKGKGRKCEEAFAADEVTILDGILPGRYGKGGIDTV